MKTIVPKQIEGQDRVWYIVDADGMTLGRLATTIAMTLRGKMKVDFAAHVDNGDYVVVLNADKVVLTGNKLANKIYYRHSGYMGGLKEMTAEEKLKKHPEDILKLAVSGMLPKTKHRAAMLDRLKLYTGTKHAHSAQNPQPLNA